MLLVHTGDKRTIERICHVCVPSVNQAFSSALISNNTALIVTKDVAKRKAYQFRIELNQLSVEDAPLNTLYQAIASQFSRQCGVS